MNQVTTFENMRKILVDMDERWLLHKFEIAAKEVNEYKKHIVHAIHQDRAKADLIEKLSPEEALLIFDFAMKFLPQKFREAQTDFFAKKGLFSLIGNINININININVRFVLACDGLCVEINNWRNQFEDHGVSDGKYQAGSFIW